MAYSSGEVTFAAGTGSKTVITGLTSAPTACRVTVADSGSSNICVGTSDGTHQNYQSTNTGSSNTKIMFLKDGSGATLQDATWSSFGFNGTNGTVTFNVTTNGSKTFTLEVWN